MKKILLVLLLCPSAVFADPNSVLWKGRYYAPQPIKPGITRHYCESHTPGTFTHRVNEALDHPLYTDKHIKLAHALFMVDKVDGIYLIQGSFVASGKQKNKSWQETIHYYLFKKSEYGLTQGVWYTNKCKGLYQGTRVSTNSIKKTD